MIALVFFSQSCFAADALLDEARTRMEARDAPGAYALLAPHELERAGDPAFDYLLGIAALDAGHVTRAIFALERVLSVQPENNLARAEIARAYIASGETDTARQELGAARKGPMPAEAAAAVDRVLGALAHADADPQRRLRGYLEAGLGWNSNVNVAPSASQFAVPAFGGITFTVQPGSRPHEAAFGMVGGGVTYQAPVAPGVDFVGSASGSFTANGHYANFDPGQVRASAGLAVTRGADTYTGALQVDGYWIGGQPYRNSGGASGQWQHVFSESVQAAVFGQWARLSYPNQTIRDVNRYVLGGGGAKTFHDGDQVVYGSLYGAHEDTLADNVPFLGHHAAGGRLGGEWRFHDWRWFGQLQAEDRRYGGIEPFFTDRRHDTQFDFNFGATLTPAAEWKLTPQIGWTHNHSNIPLYAYEKRVAQVTLRREF